MKRLLLAAALALCAHGLLFFWEGPAGRAVHRPAPQALSIRLLELPARIEALPLPAPPKPVPSPPEPPPKPPPKRSAGQRPAAAPQPTAPAIDNPVTEDGSPPEAPAPPDPPPPIGAAAAPPAATVPEPEAVVISVPRYDLNPPIVYPAPARRRNLEGTVLLDVFVTAEGRPAQVRVARSSGHALLDHSAVEAVRRWHFDPARQGANPIAMWVQVPVRYALE